MIFLFENLPDWRGLVLKENGIEIFRGIFTTILKFLGQLCRS